MGALEIVVPSTDLPSIFDYTSYRAFLRDWLEAKKRIRSKFSHRTFARLAEQKSPSLLLQVMRGDRNLTEATCASFAKALGLVGDEKKHFEDLVLLDHFERSNGGQGKRPRFVPTRRVYQAARARVEARRDQRQRA